MSPRPITRDGNVQALAAPGGVPLWVSDVLPGGTLGENITKSALVLQFEHKMII